MFDYIFNKTKLVFYQFYQTDVLPQVNNFIHYQSFAFCVEDLLSARWVYVVLRVLINIY